MDDVQAGIIQSLARVIIEQTGKPAIVREFREENTGIFITLDIQIPKRSDC